MGASLLVDVDSEISDLERDCIDALAAWCLDLPDVTKSLAHVSSAPPSGHEQIREGTPEFWYIALRVVFCDAALFEDCRFPEEAARRRSYFARRLDQQIGMMNLPDMEVSLRRMASALSPLVTETMLSGYKNWQGLVDSSDEWSGRSPTATREQVFKLLVWTWAEVYERLRDLNWRARARLCNSYPGFMLNPISLLVN